MQWLQWRASGHTNLRVMVRCGESSGVLIDPLALLGRFGHRHPTRSTQALHRRSGFDAANHEQTRGDKACASDSLAAMDNDVATGLQFGLQLS